MEWIREIMTAMLDIRVLVFVECNVGEIVMSDEGGQGGGGARTGELRQGDRRTCA